MFMFIGQLHMDFIYFYIEEREKNAHLFILWIGFFFNLMEKFFYNFILKIMYLQVIFVCLSNLCMFFFILFSNLYFYFPLIV